MTTILQKRKNTNKTKEMTTMKNLTTYELTITNEDRKKMNENKFEQFKKLIEYEIRDIYEDLFPDDMVIDMIEEATNFDIKDFRDLTQEDLANKLLNHTTEYEDDKMIIKTTVAPKTKDLLNKLNPVETRTVIYAEPTRQLNDIEPIKVTIKNVEKDEKVNTFKERTEVTIDVEENEIEVEVAETVDAKKPEPKVKAEKEKPRKIYKMTDKELNAIDDALTELYDNTLVELDAVTLHDFRKFTHLVKDVVIAALNREELTKAKLTEIENFIKLTLVNFEVPTHIIQPVTNLIMKNLNLNAIRKTILENMNNKDFDFTEEFVATDLVRDLKDIFTVEAEREKRMETCDMNTHERELAEIRDDNAQKIIDDLVTEFITAAPEQELKDLEELGMTETIFINTVEDLVTAVKNDEEIDRELMGDVYNIVKAILAYRNVDRNVTAKVIDAIKDNFTIVTNIINLAIDNDEIKILKELDKHEFVKDIKRWVAKAETKYRLDKAEEDAIKENEERMTRRRELVNYDLPEDLTNAQITNTLTEDEFIKLFTKPETKLKEMNVLDTMEYLGKLAMYEERLKNLKEIEPIDKNAARIKKRLDIVEDMRKTVIRIMTEKEHNRVMNVTKDIV